MTNETTDYVPCPACAGDPGWAACGLCNGVGCGECNGTGEVACPRCKGTEFVPRESVERPDELRTVALSLTYDRRELAAYLERHGADTTMDAFLAALEAALDREFDGAVWLAD